MLSDILKEYGAGEKEISEETLRTLAYGCLSAKHAGMFLAYTKQMGNQDLLNEIIKGGAKFPSKPEERDVLYFLAQSFRAKLLQELPKKKQKMNKDSQYFVHRSKALLKELSLISFEMAQMVMASEKEERLPDWFVLEVVRDLPRLAS